jgi:hypothetical protein
VIDAFSGTGNAQRLWTLSIIDGIITMDCLTGGDGAGEPKICLMVWPLVSKLPDSCVEGFVHTCPTIREAPPPYDIPELHGDASAYQVRDRNPEKHLAYIRED